MEATTILQKFFASRGDVSKIISPGDLKKWLPKSVDAETADEFQKALSKDRQAVAHRINSNIVREFDIPISVLELYSTNGLAGSGVFSDKQTMKGLIKQLEEIEKVSQAHEQNLDERILEYTDEIRQLMSAVKALDKKEERDGDDDDDETVKSAMMAIDDLQEMVEKTNR